MKEYMENDGAADSISYSYAQYLEDRRIAEEKYFKSQGVPANNAPEEHNLVNEDEREHKATCDPEVERQTNGNLVLVHKKEVSDPIVKSVIDKFRDRHFEGMKTYGMTMADNPAKTLEWINHVQEELMDSILYLERLKQELS